jgi:putative addiction module component (TIGR02574 family)
MKHLLELRASRLSAQSGCQLAKNRYAVDVILEKFPEVRRLSASEKLIFVSELWNDLEAHPSEVPVSREVMAELDRRMDHFREHPEEFTTWEAVKERILGSER